MKLFFGSTLVLFALLLAACNETGSAEEQAAAEQSGGEQTLAEPAAAEGRSLLVYKSPTCGCCEDWMTHLRDSGFAVSHEHPENMQAIKQELQIAPQYGSCHTGVSEGGYVFEGHVPAKAIERFLAQPPKDSIGLAVPRMPMGSPGMEMGDRFEPYDVLLLKADGSSEVYMHIAKQEQQY